MIRWLLKVLVFSMLVGASGSLGACDEDPGDKLDPPGELQVGIARSRLPAPVGIGTVGYNGLGVDGEESPFADMFPATTRVHGHPEFKAVVVSRGPDYEVIFVRADTIGVFQHYRRAVSLEVEARLGRPVENALIFGGTHTHAGPGRLIQGGAIYDIIADRFFPDFYERMVDAAATVIMDAYADLAPAGQDVVRQMVVDRCLNGGFSGLHVGQKPHQPPQVVALRESFPLHQPPGPKDPVSILHHKGACRIGGESLQIRSTISGENKIRISKSETISKFEFPMFKKA